MKDRKRRAHLADLKNLETNIALIEAPKELLKQKVMLLETPTASASMPAFNANF
jgi:hypothetical protein